MSEKYFSIVTSKDNFLANIKNEDGNVRLEKDENGKEYVASLNRDTTLILHNIAMLLPNGQKVGILPFKELAFGAEYVSVPSNQISEIYIVSEELANQIRAALAGITLAK